MSNWQEKLDKAQRLGELAKEAETRGDWVDALACWETAHDIAIGNDFRETCWDEMTRVRQIAGKNPRNKTATPNA